MAKEHSQAANGRKLPLKVWDLPTRLFHWLLVAGVAAAWVTMENGWMETHALVGQLILVLIAFRLIWGIVGSETAQFWNFIRGPKSVIAYARGLLRGTSPRSIGHNPLGACMVIVLLAIVALQASLGLFANDDIFFEGPLFHLVDKSFSDTLTGYHHLLFDFILLAVGLHVAAALFYLVVKRENLIGAMITGRKWWPQPLPRVRFTPVWAAIPALTIAGAGVWAALTYL